MIGWNDAPKGVEVRASYGNNINISYNGILSQCGADQVYLHCVTGDKQGWSNPQDQKMNRTARGWEKDVAVHSNRMLFCFKDSADNWDNNNGNNWEFYA